MITFPRSERSAILKRPEFHTETLASCPTMRTVGTKEAEADTTAPGTPRGRIDRDHDGVDDRSEGTGTGAGIGATIGGATGLLAGLGLLAIPGLGPVVAAGWLASTALGALAGGTA